MRSIAVHPPGHGRFPFTKYETQESEPLFLARHSCYAALMPTFPIEIEEWKPVARIGGVIWLVFYGLFLLYAFADKSGFLFLDYVNLIIHEGGHFFFSWFGYTITILGGTLGELLVPLLCAAAPLHAMVGVQP